METVKLLSRIMVVVAGAADCSMLCLQCLNQCPHSQVSVRDTNIPSLACFMEIMSLNDGGKSRGQRNLLSSILTVPKWCSHLPVGVRRKSLPSKLFLVDITSLKDSDNGSLRDKGFWYVMFSGTY